MKRKNWKQRLREEAQLHLPAPREPDGESYLQPDSARFLPAGSPVKTAVRYGLPALAAAAALVCVALLARGMASLPAGDSASSAFAAATEHTGAPSTATVPSPASSADTTAASHTTAISEPAPPTTAATGSIGLPPEGELVFSTVLETPGFDGSIGTYTQMADGGFVVAGMVEGQMDKRTAGDEYTTAFVARCDAQGKWLFTRFFGGNLGESFDKIIVTQDGGFLACGNTGSSTGGDFDVWGLKGWENKGVLFVKYSAAGEVQWARVVNAHNITGYAAGSVREAADGSLIGMVEENNVLEKSTTYYRFHWDAQGNPLTANVLEPVNVDIDHIADVDFSEDGSLTMAGNGRRTGVYLRLNPDGSEAFRREFSGLDFDGMIPDGQGGYAINGLFYRYTKGTDLQAAGITPPAHYRSGSSTGVFFLKMTADDTLAGGEMLVGGDTMCTSRYLTVLDGGDILYHANDMGEFIDPLSGSAPPQSRLYLYRLGADGKLKALYTTNSDLLTGVYDGLDGLFVRPDGSVLAVCMNNAAPSFIRVLRLQNGSIK